MQLIVNADDAGYSSTRDSGIMEGVVSGRITDVSALANGENFERFAALWTDAGLHAPGLHINLTEGYPISPISSVPSLINKSGMMHGKMGFRHCLKENAISMEEVRLETLAQLQKFIDCFGELPSHYDGHQHVHVLPDVTTVIAKEMSAVGITMVRCPDSPMNDTEWLDGNLLEFLNDVIADAKVARIELSRLGIRSPIHFIGHNIMGSDMTISRLRSDLSSLPTDAVCEFMVHPGRCCLPGELGCGGGVDDFSMSSSREHELNLLLSSEWKQLLDEFNIEIVSFRNAKI